MEHPPLTTQGFSSLFEVAGGAIKQRAIRDAHPDKLLRCGYITMPGGRPMATQSGVDAPVRPIGWL
jgi:hypothetical protein